MLTDEQRKRLLTLARQSIRHALGIGPAPDTSSDDPELTRAGGAFVTLHKAGQLRGCIGYVEPVASLIDTVREMAAAAALDDPRFPQVRASEEPALEIEISVMSPVEPVPDLDRIEIGRHGLVVEHGANRGLLLPQVAREWGWDREQFLAHTCMKAGLPPDAHQRGAKVYWFEAEVFGEGEGH